MPKFIVDYRILFTGDDRIEAEDTDDAIEQATELALAMIQEGGIDRTSVTRWTRSAIDQNLNHLQAILYQEGYTHLIAEWTFFDDGRLVVDRMVGHRHGLDSERIPLYPMSWDPQDFGNRIFPLTLATIYDLAGPGSFRAVIAVDLHDIDVQPIDPPQE